MLLHCARVFGSVSHWSRLHLFSMLLIPVMYYPPNSTDYEALFNVFNQWLKISLIPLCVSCWVAFARNLLWSGKPLSWVHLAERRQRRGQCFSDNKGQTWHKHSHAASDLLHRGKSVRFIKAIRSSRFLDFPKVRERKGVVCGFGLGCWINLHWEFARRITLVASRKTRMSFVQTCTTQCISEIAAQHFFPPRGGGLVWKRRLFLPDLHVEMITSWEGKKETWKTVAVEIKIYVLMKSSTELTCLDST